jgi:hypothetical protein
MNPADFNAACHEFAAIVAFGFLAWIVRKCLPNLYNHLLDAQRSLGNSLCLCHTSPRIRHNWAEQRPTGMDVLSQGEQLPGSRCRRSIRWISSSTPTSNGGPVPVPSNCYPSRAAWLPTVIRIQRTTSLSTFTGAFWIRQPPAGVRGCSAAPSQYLSSSLRVAWQKL